jgi:hypothetical protein
VTRALPTADDATMAGSSIERRPIARAFRRWLVTRGVNARRSTRATLRELVPPRAIPAVLARAVTAALAAGESLWTIAARHGLAIEQVRP